MYIIYTKNVKGYVMKRFNLCPSAYFIASDDGEYLHPCTSLQAVIESMINDKPVDVYQREVSLGKCYKYIFSLYKKSMKGGDC